MGDLNIGIAFGAGFLSFISPCCLPIYPAFLSYITGVSLSDLQNEKRIHKSKTLLHTLFFLLGFTLIFIVLGFSTSIIGSFFMRYQDFIRQVGAILIVFLGLVVTGIFQPKFLMSDRRFQFSRRPSGFLGSTLIGLAFAAGWTPCTGPILTSVFALAVSNPGSSLFYMLAYTLGFSIPFFVLSFYLGSLTWIKKNSHKIVVFGGYIMIIMGIMLYFDWLTKITIYFTRFFGGFTGF
ncbi:cytochrome c biogenesis CcdA family protein [Bacillus sp. AFS017336]|uniref:cytochrome c biogenesis CcdA family protein n=1 Tax=Bacillus sp. AFS017336 TaxID=2033489 RepID=UPI000BF1532E|nr:cytochrome c biogenesis protein CcdA [Bacillus sp. AFS017336]PEL12708.1 cytochrome C biogenesis protein CcdA [Bacillus sp. AFS017336]